MSTVTLQSTLRCPACGHAEIETMLVNACQWFYECRGCHTVLQPKLGDCCVFCSFGTVPCPPVQIQRLSAAKGRSASGSAGSSQ